MKVEVGNECEARRQKPTHMAHDGWASERREKYEKLSFDGELIAFAWSKVFVSQSEKSFQDN